MRTEHYQINVPNVTRFMLLTVLRRDINVILFNVFLEGVLCCLLYSAVY